MDELEQYKMKPDEFESALKLAVEFAEQRIGQEADDESIPYLFIHCRPDEGDKLGEMQITMCALAIELATQEDKRKLMRSMGAKCYIDRQMPMALFFVSEAYSSRRGQPMDDPNAGECMIVMAMSVGGPDAVMVSVPLKRDDKGLFQRAGPNMISRTGTSPLLINFWTGFASAAMSRESPPPDEEGGSGRRAESFPHFRASVSAPRRATDQPTERRKEPT